MQDIFLGVRLVIKAYAIHVREDDVCSDVPRC